MTFLDTHVAVWLFMGDRKKLSVTSQKRINADKLVVSPIVYFELCYLHEIGRINYSAQDILVDLSRQLAVSIQDAALHTLVLKAETLTWTRDPFDRLIVAHAAIENAQLISKDQTIRRNYPQTVW